MLLVAVASLVGALLCTSGVAGANQRVESEAKAPRAKASLSLGQLGFESVSTRSVTERAVGPRARRPRAWKMPVAVAERATLAFAMDIYANTTPNEFDESGTMIGTSDWDDYAAGLCKRKSKSRVNCTGLVEAYYDVVNEANEVVGEDTFYCIWDQTNWYPRARFKRLNTDIPSEYCGWESDDAV